MKTNSNNKDLAKSYTKENTEKTTKIDKYNKRK